MASFTNDPNHYAHPLFQHESVPTKKKANKSKNLPSWMSHTVKKGYTSYLVHVNATTLEPKDYRPPRHVGGFEPSGLKYTDFPKTEDEPPKEIFVLIENKIGKIKNNVQITTAWKNLKEHVEKINLDSIEHASFQLKAFVELLTVLSKKITSNSGFHTKKTVKATGSPGATEDIDSIYVEILKLLGLNSVGIVNEIELENFNDGFNLYNLVVYSKNRIKTKKDSWLARALEEPANKKETKEEPANKEDFKKNK